MHKRASTQRQDGHGLHPVAAGRTVDHDAKKQRQTMITGQRDEIPKPPTGPSLTPCHGRRRRTR